MKRIIFLILALLIFSSCNNKNSHYKLIVEFKTSFNNKFRLYYSKRPYQDIDGQNYIDKYIYSSPSMQKIVFNFPEEVVPYKIRFDVGENQEIENIIIKNISIKYGENIIDGDDGVFMNYWSPNECLRFNDKKYYYEILKNKDSIKTPVFMSNIHMETEIKTLRPYIFW